jgi:uncharacterized radical SAM superfamily protein
MIEELTSIPLDDLQAQAFRVRKIHFGKELTFSIPSTVAYRHGDFPTQKDRFAAISITGTRCDLRCDHCDRKLLESMIPAEDPQTFHRISSQLISRGSSGLLISGGADRHGEVPLREFIPVIRNIKEKHPQFKVIVHTGLIRKEVAKELKEARVDQILIDVIGDDETIQRVYHLNRCVEDYEETLCMLKEMGHHLAPHLIIGHHFGEIKGEWRALEIITRVGVETLVLVVIKPFPQTEMGQIQIPKPEETSRVSAIARILNPTIPIRIGCIRPAHPWKAEMERGFILSGANTIAYPLQGTIDYAEGLGLETRFEEVCCSLIGISHERPVFYSMGHY